MDPYEWKKSVTGENCPPWCAQEHHADEDPEDPTIESYFHESGPISLRLPATGSGTEFRLNTTTFSADNLLDETVGPVRLITTVGSTGNQGGHVEDLDINTKADLDRFIADLHAYATALGQWRDRLPD